MATLGVMLVLVAVVVTLAGLISVVAPLRRLRIRTRGRGAMVAVVGIVLFFAGGSLLPASTTTQASTAPTATVAAVPALPTLDAGAYLACRQFGSVAQNERAGILTATELRDQLKEIHDHAAAFPGSAVDTASTAVLRSVTIGNSEALNTALAAMVVACKDWPHRAP